MNKSTSCSCYRTSKHLCLSTQITSSQKEPTNKEKKKGNGVPRRHPHKLLNKRISTLFGTFKIQDQYYGDDKNCNNDANYPLVHILLDMAVKILLLFPMLSSTPCSRENNQISDKFSPFCSRVKCYRPW